MTITIHDANLRQVGWIDNDKQETLNYYDDLWILDLATGSSTFEFTVAKKVLKTDIGNSRLYEALNERSFVSFEEDGKTYLFNVMEFEETEKTITCYCETLNLELLNEIAQPYESKTPKTFIEYANAMGLLKYSLLKVGLNEIKTKKLALSFSSEETKLARLLNLVAQFGAEIEFDTKLKPNGQLKSFKINIHHGHDASHHGVGSKRTDLVLRYGKNLKGITRKVSKKNLYTMIVPTGKRSDSTKSRRTTVMNPDGTRTVTDKVAQSNGNYTVTTTKLDKAGKVLSTKKVTVTKQSDGSLRKSTSTNASGSVTTTSSNTVVVKNKDKSTTKTTTVKKSDGSVEKTIVHTKTTKRPDKTTITVVTTTKPDGSVTERTTTKYANGSSNTQTKVVKAGTRKNATTISKVDSSNDSEFDLDDMKDWKKKNSKGELEFYKKGVAIYANLAKDLYPGSFTSADSNDQWIRIDKEYEADSDEELNALALADLEEMCYPEITYEINGFVGGGIGDSVWIEDDGFSTLFQATARISRLEISKSNPSRNKTVVTNINVVKSMLSDGITSRFDALVEASRPYDMRLETDSGIAFKNGQGTSTVIPTLLKGAFEVTENVSFNWNWNGQDYTGDTFVVEAVEVAEKAVLTVTAMVGTEEVASSTLTFTNVFDGKQGTPGTSSYTHWVYSVHADGHDMTELPNADTVYAGQCVTDSQERPSDYRLYTWSKIKGDKGTFEGEIGGRNYVLNSDVSTTSGRSFAISPDFLKLAKGKRITISVEVEGVNISKVGNNRWGISLSVDNPNNTSGRSYLEVWQTGEGNISKRRISKSFDWLESYSNPFFAIYHQSGSGTVVSKPKLSISDIDTDWSPAPEDIQDQIDSKAQKEDVVYKTDINITDEGIIHSASKTVNGQTIASMIAQRAEWVEIIARLLKVKGDMLVDGSITSTKFNGNVISSLDGTLVFDLAKSSLVSYSDNSVIRRVSDNQSQFIKMATVNKVTYTTIGSNRTANDESIGTADFTGLQFRSRSTAKGGLVDEGDLWVDSLYISGGGKQADGVHFKNGQWLRPVSSARLYLGMNDRRWREVHSNEYYLQGRSLRPFLKAIRNCLRQFANGGATQQTYDYIKGQLSSELDKLP